MKKLLALLLSLIFLVQLPAPVALASFDDQGGGARAPGMADSFTAVADDADAIGYNPAGLVQMQEGQISTQYGQLVKGLGDGSTLGTTYLGYAYPLVKGYRAIGFAYNNFKGDNLFSERTLILSYSQRIDLDSLGYRGIYSFGGNVKQLHRQYEPDRFTENALNDAGVASNQHDQLFTAGNSKDTYAFDLGALAQFGPKYEYTAGVALINANQPDVSIAGDGDKAPLGVKMGAAYRPRWGTLSIENRRVKRLVGQTDSDVALGAERNFPFASLGALVLRGGYATGSRGYRALTTGLSYMYSRFRLDYSFSFPVSNLADTSGTHRVGFAFKLGSSSTQFARDYSNTDLISAFAWDSLTTHILLTRISLARGLTPEYKDQLMFLLMRKYPLDDPGLKNVSGDLKDLLRKYANNTMDWAHLKFALLKGVPEDEKSMSMDALESLVKNDPKSTLMRLAVMPANTQRSDRLASLSLMALSELAAQTYRRQDLDGCIGYVRRMVEILPSDEVVLRAYRELLARRAKITDKFNANEAAPAPAPLPEAPQSLVAPSTHEEKSATPAQMQMSDRDALLRAFGTALGYYMVRKAQNAPHDELVGLLNQMKVVYGDQNFDLSMIDRELAELNANGVTPAVAAPTIAPTPVPAITKPAAKPAKASATKKPAEKPVAKPTAKPKKVTPVPTNLSGFKIPADADLDRAWEYYRTVSERDITDYEKIELLQDMLRRFGEQGAGRINKELERIRRRVE